MLLWIPHSRTNSLLYSIIYADPPWTYRDKAVAGKRGAGFKYPTLDLPALRRLPVADLAAADSVLFLWATWPLLPQAIELMSAWGFQYRTIGFIWVKSTRTGEKLFWGMGNWTRSNSEICLLGVRGNPRRASAGVHSVIQAPVRAHSQKPAEVRDRIVALMGDLPRIELFARDLVLGWDAWGNEVMSDLDLQPRASGPAVERGRQGRSPRRPDLTVPRQREPTEVRIWSADEIVHRLLSRLRKAPHGLILSDLLRGMPGVSGSRVKRLLTRLAEEGLAHERGPAGARRWLPGQEPG